MECDTGKSFDEFLKENQSKQEHQEQNNIESNLDFTDIEKDQN